MLICNLHIIMHEVYNAFLTKTKTCRLAASKDSAKQTSLESLASHVGGEYMFYCGVNNTS